MSSPGSTRLLGRGGEGRGGGRGGEGGGRGGRGGRGGEGGEGAHCPPFRRSCNKGARSGGISKWPSDITANSL